MEINIKLSNLLNINSVLKEIIENKDNVKSDSLFKFKLLTIMKSLEGHISNFEAVKNDKIQEYGKPDEDGKIVVSPDDKEMFDKFVKDINELLNSEVTINIHRLKAADVFDKGIDAEYLVKLYDIMEE
ncbi:MAG: hypothetical protein K2M78_12025 [Lachnospiraceae bacterium]|nr:hypothetical protein [Lachnospiraceae bacterium]